MKFTTEVEEDFDCLRLPTLSFEVWSNSNGIMHSYYEKPMRCQTLTGEKSSQSDQSKYSILVNELARRFEVMSESVTIEERISTIDHFTQQLKNSGYEFKQSREIVLSMLKGWRRKEERRKDQEKRYLSAKDTLLQRNMDKLTEATTWYRKKKENKDENNVKESSYNFENMSKNDEKQRWKEKTQSWKGWRKCKKRIKPKRPEDERTNGETGEEEKLQSVIFIQHTLHSELAKRVRAKLKELENVGRIKVKIVERTGDKLSDVLCKSDSWADEDCGRQDCIICASAGEDGRKGMCKKRNILYETYCETCEMNDDEKLVKIVENEERKDEDYDEKYDGGRRNKRKIEDVEYEDRKVKKDVKKKGKKEYKII